jgi:anti-sigma regulatory factor (Ser/Thr protein kinase)
MKHSVTFPGEPSRLADIRSLLRGLLQDVGFEEIQTASIVLAVDEACTNIIRHAHCGETKPVTLSFHQVDNQVRIVLEDCGVPCDPARIKGRALEDVRPGGMGVHIIHQVFDFVEYLPLESGTRLTLEKNITPSQSR